MIKYFAVVLALGISSAAFGQQGGGTDQEGRPVRPMLSDIVPKS
jgi:hypothetical protein